MTNQNSQSLAFSKPDHVNYKINPITLPSIKSISQTQQVLSGNPNNYHTTTLNNNPSGNNNSKQTLLPANPTSSQRHLRSKTMNIQNVSGPTSGGYDDHRAQTPLKDEYEHQVLELLKYGEKSHQTSKTLETSLLADFILNPIQKEKRVMTEVEFSYSKAIRRIQIQNYTEAVKCCKETLQLDQKNFECIYNLAVLYDVLHRPELATKWFSLAFRLRQDDERVAFGLSLSLFKCQKYEKAIDYITEIVEKAHELCLEEAFHSKNFVYLRALCNRRLHRNPEAERDYKLFIQLCCPSSFELLKKLMFTFLFKKLRGLEVQFDLVRVFLFSKVYRPEKIK